MTHYIQRKNNNTYCKVLLLVTTFINVVATMQLALTRLRCAVKWQ